MCYETLYNVRENIPVALTMTALAGVALSPLPHYDSSFTAPYAAMSSENMANACFEGGFSSQSRTETPSLTVLPVKIVSPAPFSMEAILEKAERNTQHLKEKLLTEARAVPWPEFKQKLSTKSPNEDDFLFLPVEDGERLYPEFQIKNNKPLTGLTEVLKAFEHIESPWMLVSFMLSENTFLNGETPLAALQQGKREAVISAAKSYGIQNGL